MNTFTSHPIVWLFEALGAGLLVLVLTVSSFFGYEQPTQPLTVATTTVGVQISRTNGSSDSVATSSTHTASTTTPTPTPKKPIPIPVVTPPKPPEPVPQVISPCLVISPLDSSSTSTQPTVLIGTTTLAIQSVPLLVGGTAHAGGSVPVSYLQITNIGTECALLKGFWVTQRGSAPTQSVTGLSTVDDTGGSRGLIEGSLLFQNGTALAPTYALFAPGQMLLFTIKVNMALDVSPYVGTQLILEVASVESTASVRGQFPIQGTTWTIAQ